MLGHKGSTKVGGRGGVLRGRAGWCQAVGAIALCALLLAVVPVGEGDEEGLGAVAGKAEGDGAASAAPLILQLVPDGIDPAEVDSIPGAVVLPESALPPFDPNGCRIDLPAITRDEDIALLSLPAGTDEPDYRLDGGAGDRIVVGERGVVEVPGHLWTDAKPQTLVIEARKDVTIWVRGRLYLQRSIRVEGLGRVAFVMGAAVDPEDATGSSRTDLGHAVEPVACVEAASLPKRAGSADRGITARLFSLRPHQRSSSNPFGFLLPPGFGPTVHPAVAREGELLATPPR